MGIAAVQQAAREWARGEDLELQVCPDCMVWVANGDDSGLDVLDVEEAEERRACRDRSVGQLGRVLHVSDVPHDPFSWGRCELCLALPGERHTVVAV